MIRAKIKLFIFIICGLAFLTAHPATSASGAKGPLVLQVHPYLPSTEIMKRFGPLADYLGKAAGRPVVVKVSVDYGQHIDLIGKDKADLAFMGPSSYVSMVWLHGKKPLLARFEIRGKPTFRGTVIVRKGSRLKSLSELKGKRFAFGDPASTMSHLVPRYMMWKAGVDLKDLAGHAFLNNHHNVVLGILMGKFDAGAVKDEVFYSYEKRGLRVLAWTPELSEHLFITSSALPKDTGRRLREALLRLGESGEGRKIMKGVNERLTGMVGVDDSDYENLRTIMQELKAIGVKP